MQRSRLRPLVALNAVLLAALAAVTFAPIAEGQGPARARGQYTMVAGRVQGSTEEVVYVYDAANRELVAISYDRSRRASQPIGFRDVNADSGRGAVQPR
ncbi:MAG: hypothetical protein IBJ10_08320 [Phycisphaerales bacterium]|nr:hypothetical protein [Phycisphaerales bacterium]